MKAAAASFPMQTGFGADNIAPRALLRLSGQLLCALIAILLKMESIGSWTSELDLVLIVLLAKSDGGLRPQACSLRSSAFGCGPEWPMPDLGKLRTPASNSTVAPAWEPKELHGWRPSARKPLP